MFLRSILASSLVVVLSAAVAHADAKEEVLAAAKKLADADGYSWSSVTESGMGRGGRQSEGKRLKDGTTYMSMPMRDGKVEAVFRGEKGAVNTPDGWLSLEQAARGDDSGRPAPGLMLVATVRGFKTPAEQAQEMAGRAEGLAKAEDGSIAGTLPEDYAKTLMQMRRRPAADGDGAAPPAPEISGANGTVAFWTDADGRLSKVQYKVAGTMTFNGEERQLDRTTTIEIKDVGATAIEIPAEAKAAMGE